MSTETNHAGRAHALLSASGSERWINCPASPRLEEHFEEQTSSYAEEGTLAHELSEIILRLDLKLLSMVDYKQKFDEIKKNKYYSEDMFDEVTKYTSYVKQQYQAAKRVDKHARLLIEEKLDLTEWIPEGFGTSDAIVICNLGIEVIDLKYGKGKPVYAQENTQLMSYGLGAMKVAKKSCTFNKVTVTIVQPRLDNISDWSLSVKALTEWGDNVLKVKAVEAFSGDGEQKAGDWCQFCKARAKCRALHDLGMAIVRRDFEEQIDPRLINDDELLEVYKSADFIKKWLEDVKEVVLKEALQGKQWQGYKLVEGKSNRQWVDETKVTQELADNLYEPEQFLNFKLKGLGDLEKLLKKANFEKILGHLIVKPPGAPTLVDENDKRELYGVSQVKKDFAEIIDEDDFELD